jgi:hypothetical protein
VTLLATVTLKDDATSSAPLEIGADVIWTVCDEICLIDRAKLDLSLPVVDAASARPSGDAKVFAESKARLAKENDGTFEVTWEGKTLRVAATDAMEMRYYAIRGGAEPVDLIDEGHAKGSSVSLRFEGEGELHGVVEATMPDGSHVIRRIATTMPE